MPRVLRIAGHPTAAKLEEVKLALRVGGLVLAIAILYIIVSRIGAEQIAAQLSQVGPGFIWILVLHAAAIAIAAIPWYVLLPLAARPTIGGAIISRFFAQGAAAVLPLFGLGGELVRLFWLRKGERAPGVAAIIADRLMYGASGAVLLVAGLIGLLHVPALPDNYARTAAIGIGALITLVIVGSLLAHRGIGVRVHRLVDRMRRKVDSDTEFGEGVDRHVTAMLRFRQRGPWVALGLHALARAVIGLEFYVAFYLLGVSLTWDQALVFAALPVILSISGAVVPSQLGVHEAANALVAASFGIAPSTAVAVVLLMRLRQLAGAAILGPVILFRRRTITGQLGASGSASASA